MAEETKKEGAVQEAQVSAREQLYENYEKTLVPAKEEPKAPEVKPEAAPVEAEKPKEPEKPKEAQEEVKPPQKDKFVPYDALHAERLKRKAEAEARKAAEERAKQFEEELKKFAAQKESEPITDYDAEINQIKRREAERDARLRAFEEMEKKRQEREESEAKERLFKQNQENIKKTHGELYKEGYPGFEFSLSRVTDVLMEIQRTEGDDAALALDNPTGWKKIYKEAIFPELRKEFEGGLQIAREEEKKNLKAQATMVTTPGRTEPKPKPDSDKTEKELYEEYIKQRRGY